MEITSPTRARSLLSLSSTIADSSWRIFTCCFVDGLANSSSNLSISEILFSQFTQTILFLPSTTFFIATSRLPDGVKRVLRSFSRHKERIWKCGNSTAHPSIESVVHDTLNDAVQRGVIRRTRKTRWNKNYRPLNGLPPLKPTESMFFMPVAFLFAFSQN